MSDAVDADSPAQTILLSRRPHIADLTTWPVMNRPACDLAHILINQFLIYSSARASTDERYLNTSFVTIRGKCLRMRRNGIAGGAKTEMQIRRIVTGHNATGKAIVLTDGPAPVVHNLKSLPGFVLGDLWSRSSRAEVWSTSATPAPIGTDWDPDKLRPMPVPWKNGTALKIVELQPDARERDEPDTASAPLPIMQRTETVDYAIVLSGEVYLVLDDSEVLVGTGDVVIQQGNKHAWSNRSKQTCRIALFMIDGKYVRAHFQ